MSSIATMRSPCFKPARSPGLPATTSRDERRTEVGAQAEHAQRVAFPVAGLQAADREPAGDAADPRRSGPPARSSARPPRGPAPWSSASAGPASSSPARRRSRRPGRPSRMPAAAAGVPGVALGQHARAARGCRPCTCPRRAGRRAAGWRSDRPPTIAMRLPDALAVERVRQVRLGRGRPRARRPSSRSRRAGSRTAPIRCRSGPNRRDATTRPKPTEKRSTLTPHQRATT